MHIMFVCTHVYTCRLWGGDALYVHTHSPIPSSHPQQKHAPKTNHSGYLQTARQLEALAALLPPLPSPTTTDTSSSSKQQEEEETEAGEEYEEHGFEHECDVREQLGSAIFASPLFPLVRVILGFFLGGGRGCDY